MFLQDYIIFAGTLLMVCLIMSAIRLLPLIAISGASAVLTGCQDTEHGTKSIDQNTVQESVQPKPVWAGSYQGHTPCLSCSALCEECEGMSVKLTLKEDMQYELQRISMSGNDISETLTGRMLFKDEAKTQLELVGVSKRNLLLVNVAKHEVEIRMDQSAKAYASQQDFLMGAV
ncbi:hypothetical protein D9K81_11715 [Acinetobacter chengduensis]|uniref:NlpE N-terminal domain-containing protein n=2 Tax=Moraxellaceae TaxID=468 RepID=A0ABX9TUP5_9GAMM|nr:hypothetical protein D7V31_08965 [Acinetobacter sp. WCHAc060007]RLL20661.1 hypothetical protein D9K81_11715 [Acinetobacter chengduensis]